jgi:uncharacterized phage protein (TIGR02218 family)
MKTIPAALQAHYDTGNTCLAYAIVIQREDGALYGFTSHDQSFSMDVSPWGYGSSELVFNAEQGFSASDIVSTAGFEVDNLELTTLDDGTLFDRDEVLAGAWTNAQFRIFRYRWDVSPIEIADDVETLIRGWFGEVTLNQNTFRIELRGLAQKLQQTVGIVSTKTCRARLGDSACTKDLTSFTHTLTVTGVTDKRTFTASGATQDPDYFGEGIVTWLTGDNAAGRAHKVRAFESGVFTLSLPTVLPVQVGDTFTAVAGCRKRLMEDCKTKFNNVLNFQGEPHRPTVDTLTKAP